MGFYLRKALSVGPFRFNLSKSGLGISAGVKGLRIGAGPRGNYVHMGREGLYFRKSLSDNKRMSFQAKERNLVPKQSPDSFSSLEEIDSGSVLEMVDSSSTELLKELNSKLRKGPFLPIAIALTSIVVLASMIGGAPTWLSIFLLILSVICLVLTSISDKTRRTTVILYDLDPEVEAAYQKVHDAFNAFRSCSNIWHIEARADIQDVKYNAGATAIVRRSSIVLSTGQPFQVKTNIEIPMIPVGSQTLAFMPDRLLVFERGAVGAVPYDELRLESTASNTAEQGVVAADTTVVGTTWQYVNKKGGPDFRFKDNREIPICAYEQLHFGSNSGLNEIIQVSAGGRLGAFAEALSTMASLNTRDSAC